MNILKNFHPKKSLGQHFLVNPRVIDRIITACRLTRDSRVLEIGPGKGALTRKLSECCRSVVAVEKDNKLAECLSREFAGSNVAIVHADILKYRFAELPPRIKAIGNLPYNIATPIIEQCIAHRDRFSDFYTTVQLEYGQRIVAGPGTKRYGALSCFVQYYAQARMLFRIGNASFKPAPKVQSCFLHLKFFDQPPHRAENEKRLFQIIRSCFGQRRKTIVNSLANTVEKNKIPDLLKTLGIDPKSRAENLHLKDYVGLANAAG